MAEDREAHFTQLRAGGNALTIEFNAIKRDHESGLMLYDDAIARHRAISREMRAIATEMRALVPARSNYAPPDSN